VRSPGPSLLQGTSPPPPPQKIRGEGEGGRVRGASGVGRSPPARGVHRRNGGSEEVRPVRIRRVFRECVPAQLRARSHVRAVGVDVMRFGGGAGVPPRTVTAGCLPGSGQGSVCSARGRRAGGGPPPKPPLPDLSIFPSLSFHRQPPPHKGITCP
jgi:hypothetical protein